MRFLMSILFLSLASHSVIAREWTGYDGCGLYNVDAVARSGDQGINIVVNEKTKSEFTILIPSPNQVFLMPYLDKDFTARVQLSSHEKFKLQGEVKEITYRIPNPMNPTDTGIRLISKGKCK